MKRKQKILGALLGTIDPNSLTGEDISWATSYLPDSDEKNQVVTGLSFGKMIFDHSKTSIDEAIPIGQGVEKMRKAFTELPQSSKVSEFVEKLIHQIDEEMIVFILTKYTTDILEEFQGAQEKGMLELLKKLRSRG